MCGFTFTVFLSAFQLLPTAPFHILDLGGSTFAAGLFLGFLTYSSAFSAPLTGALADRVGQRRILIVASLAITVFSAGYAVIPDFRVMLALALVHGVFWSGLLSASSRLHDQHSSGAAARGGHRLLGPVVGAGHCGRSAARLLDLPLGLVRAVRGWRRAQSPDGAHRLAIAESPVAASPSGAPRRRAACIEWRVLVPLVHAVPLFVRVWRHHELHGALRRRQRRVAKGHLSDHAGARDPGDPPVVRPAGGSVRLQAGVRAEPRAHQRRPGVSGIRRHARWMLASRSSSAPASAPPIPSLSGSSCRACPPVGAAPRSGRSSPRSTPGSAPARRPWGG